MFFYILPSGVGSPVCGKAFLRGQRELLGPISGVSYVRYSEGLVFQGGVHRRKYIGVFNLYGDSSFFTLYFVFGIIVNYVGFVHAFRTSGGAVRGYLRSFGFPRRLQVVYSTRLILSILGIMILLFKVIGVSITSRIRSMYRVSSITLRRFSTRIGVIRSESGLTIYFLP